jgi:hypothetical protein
LLGGGFFNLYLSPRRIFERWSKFFSAVFGVWTLNSRMNLSAQENTENTMRSRIAWNNESVAIAEKQQSITLQNYDFVPIEVNFDTLGKISDIHVLDRIKFTHDGKLYNAIIKEVTTTERLENLEITALLTHKVPI